MNRQIPVALIAAVRDIRLLQYRNSEADAALLNTPLLTLVDAVIHPNADLRAKDAVDQLLADPTIEFDALDLGCEYYSVLGQLRQGLSL